MFYTVLPRYALQFPSSQSNTNTTLQHSTDMITKAADVHKPRKYRASCDACSRAKVRCDKVRPSCHRCKYIGIVCNYSPSMRLGKPRKTQSLESNVLRSISPATPYGSLVSHLELVPCTPSLAVESVPQYLDPLSILSSGPDYAHQDLFITNPLEPQHSYSGSGLWHNDTALAVQSSPEQLSHWPSYSLTQGHSHSQASSIQAQPGRYLPSYGHIHSSPILSPQFCQPPTDNLQLQESLPSAALELRHPSPSPSGSTPVPEHDCTKAAFRILNRLYSFPEPGPTISVSSEPASDSTFPTNILSVTEHAVNQIFYLLSCPCTDNPHFSTTISFTITKILSLYETIACDHKRPAAPQHSTTDALVPAQAAEAWRHSQHILGQLRKIETLIDRVQDKYCNTDTTGIHAGDARLDSSVYSSLEASLRASVRDTFRAVMRHAPEGIRRQVASQSARPPRPRTITI